VLQVPGNCIGPVCCWMIVLHNKKIIVLVRGKPVQDYFGTCFPKDKNAVTAVVVVCNNILEEEHWMLPNILSEILVQLMMVCIDFALIQQEYYPCQGRDGRLLEFLDGNKLSIARFHNETCDVDGKELIECQSFYHLLVLLVVQLTDCCRRCFYFHLGSMLDACFNHPYSKQELIVECLSFVPMVV
jgi:hypothetical protein